MGLCEIKQIDNKIINDKLKKNEEEIIIYEANQSSEETRGNNEHINQIAHKNHAEKIQIIMEAKKKEEEEKNKLEHEEKQSEAEKRILERIHQKEKAKIEARKKEIEQIKIMETKSKEEQEARMMQRKL